MTYREDMRRAVAADAHRGHKPKRTAAILGLTVRRVQAWRNPDYTKGSPAYRYHEALEAADEPFIMLAHAHIVVERMNLKDVPTSALIRRYRELLIEDKLHESRDTANSLCGAMTWEARQKDSAQDAAHDIEKAAIEQEFMARRVPVSEVLG